MKKGPEELLTSFPSTKKASPKNAPTEQKERGWDEGDDLVLGKGNDSVQTRRPRRKSAGFFGPPGCVGLHGLGKQTWVKIKAHDRHPTVIINNKQQLMLIWCSLCVLYCAKHFAHVLFYFTNNSAVLLIFFPSFYR